MKHFNSMSVSSYFWTNCVWTSLLVALCRKLLYGYFGTRDLPDGKLLLAVLVAAVAVGMLLTMKQYRNDANVVINIFLGASVGLTAAAWVYCRSVALAAVAAAAVTVAGYLALVLVRYRGKRGAGRRASLGRCRPRWAYSPPRCRFDRPGPSWAFLGASAAAWHPGRDPLGIQPRPRRCRSGTVPGTLGGPPPGGMRAPSAGSRVPPITTFPTKKA